MVQVGLWLRHGWWFLEEEERERREMEMYISSQCPWRRSRRKKTGSASVCDNVKAKEIRRCWECDLKCPGPAMQISTEKLGQGWAQPIQSVYVECQGHGGRLAPKDRLSCNGGEMVQGQILQVHLENELWLEDNTVWWKRPKPRIEPGDTARLEGPCCFYFLCDEKTFYMYHQHSFQKPIPTLHNQITLITTSSKADCQPLRRQRRWATWRHANKSWNMPIPYGKASSSS